VGTTRENPAADGKPAAVPDPDTRNFIEKYHVTKLSPKAVPGSGEESADLLPDVEGDRSPKS
jgi:hypothetical protein